MPRVARSIRSICLPFKAAAEFIEAPRRSEVLCLPRAGRSIRLRFQAASEFDVFMF